MNSLLRKLRWLTQRASKESELRDELQFHLEEEAENAKHMACYSTGRRASGRLPACKEGVSNRPAHGDTARVILSSAKVRRLLNDQPSGRTGVPTDPRWIGTEPAERSRGS